MWRNWRERFGNIIAATFGALALNLMWLYYSYPKMPFYPCEGNWVCEYFWPLCCWEQWFR